MKKVIVLGANGQLGLTLNSLSNPSDIHIRFFSKREIDITKKNQLNKIFKEFDFDYCVNCAAYTNVELAEKEEEKAFLINAEGAKNIAEICKTYKTKLIHISTDYVFDGSKENPYNVSDTPNPINIYGASKLEGEKLIKKSINDYYIIRASWLYSVIKKNFFNTIINKIGDKEALKITTDQTGTPTSCVDLAEFIFYIINSDSIPFGIYHFSARGHTTWYGFAEEIVRDYNKSYLNKIEAVSTFKSNAKRPKYSVLNVEKTEDIYRPLNPWEYSIAETVKQLKKEENIMSVIDINNNLNIAIDAALEAGEAIMDVYNTGFSVEFKDDKSPLTDADQRANTIINSFLKKTPIPIISEENKQINYNTRKSWDTCWIVDPVDGTKEFIKRNGEFTVNIALVQQGKPILGVIYVPVTKTLYFGNVQEEKAFKAELSSHKCAVETVIEQAKQLKPKSESNLIEIVGSRSHMNEETLEFVSQLKSSHKEVEIVSKGSSLKFCLVAEGNADIYPRFAPTMEWDTAAGQAICNAVGINVISKETNAQLLYNKENLLNPWFIVSK